MQMNLSTLFLIIVIGSLAAYFLGHRRSYAVAKPVGGIRNLAALPSYYASLMSLWAFFPALLLVSLWLVLDSSIINSLVKSSMPTEAKQLDVNSFGLIYSQVENVAAGIGSIEVLGC